MCKTLAEINNNPLNLRPLPGGQKWEGQTDVSHNNVSGAFCVFKDNTYGVRAAVVNLRSYVRAGVTTLKAAIYRWAPPNVPEEVANGVGNHTAAYVFRVCAHTGLSEHYSIAWLNGGSPSAGQVEQLVTIIEAMNMVEAGKMTVSRADIRIGINRALSLPTGTVRRDDGNVVIADIKDSTIVKDSNKGTVLEVIKTAPAAAAPFLVPGLDWKIAAIVAAAVLLGGAGTAYYFWKTRKARLVMHENGVA